MAQYGITSAGFIRKPFSVIKDELETKARDLFESDIDLSIYSPAGLFVQLLAWNNNLIWQELESSYYANWLDTAEGANLDRVVELGGLTRRKAQFAILQDVEFRGDTDTVIPQGFLIEDKNGVQFNTAVEAKIDASLGGGKGIAVIDCTAVAIGAGGAVAANTVTETVNPLSGLDSVTNPTASVGASDNETDAELRERYMLEGVESSGSSIDAIRSAVMAVDNVIEAVIYENTDTGEDGEGRPGKSIECVVLYADDDPDVSQKVAKAIFETKPAGIETFGNITIAVPDENNNTYDIHFNTPEIKNVYVTVNLDVIEGVWQSAYLNQITTNIIEYIGGVDMQLIDGTATPVSYKGLPINEDVFTWRIAGANKEIPGIENIEVFIDFSPDPIAAVVKLAVGVRELARCGGSFITINPTVVS